MGVRDTSSTALALALVFVVVAIPGTAAMRQPEPHPDRPALATAAGEQIAALAAILDYDVERIFRFVADEIRYEPYIGILRGAKGTLDSGAGNSVDQALLLAALLDESLITYRFARGTMDGAAATRLLDSAIQGADEAREMAADVLIGDIDETTVLDADVQVLDENDVAQLLTEVDEGIAFSKSQLEETITTIGSALADSGIALPSAAPGLPIPETNGHTWVQFASGADWMDLDPSLHGSEPGMTLASVAESLDQLPDSLRHAVEFELLLERVRGDQLVTEPILNFSAYADELWGASLTFGHIPPSAAERLGVAIASFFGEGAVRYFPYFEGRSGSIVADEAVAFDVSGAGGDGGILGESNLLEVAEAPEDAAGVATGEATAEWLEVRVTRPGHEQVTGRRAIFDRVPPEIRFGGTPSVEDVRPVELVDLDASGSVEFAPMLGMRSFVIASGPTSVATLVAGSVDNPNPLVTLAAAYHVLRDGLAAKIALEDGVRLFIDGPNVVSFGVEFGNPQSGQFVVSGLDIWHRDTGALPLAGSSASISDSPLAGGILGHIAERLAVEAIAAGSESDKHDPVGVGSLFETANRAGIERIVISGDVPVGLAYGPRADAMIAAAIIAGDVIVIPATLVTVGGRERIGWWQIDPATGAIIDVMDDGSGATLVEHIGQVANRLASCVYVASGFILAIAVVLAAASGQSPVKLADASIIGSAISLFKEWGQAAGKLTDLAWKACRRA